MLGAVGIVGEPLEKSRSATSAFKHHQAPSPLGFDQKGEHHNGEKGVKSTSTAEITAREGAETESEEEDEVIYPRSFQLGLLVLGLCMATFTVALGEFGDFVSYCY